jgi:ribosome-associated protein
MSNDIFVTSTVTIPESELEITASRSGGAGGQHVNKTDTRITIRWNVLNSCALTEAQKERVLTKIGHRLATDGDLIIHHSSTRSQQQNKKNALQILAQQVRNALYIPKKRIPTKVSKTAKEARLKEKSHRSSIKKMRKKEDI